MTALVRLGPYEKATKDARAGLARWLRERLSDGTELVWEWDYTREDWIPLTIGD